MAIIYGSGGTVTSTGQDAAGGGSVTTSKSGTVISSTPGTSTTYSAGSSGSSGTNYNLYTYSSGVEGEGTQVIAAPQGTTPTVSSSGIVSGGQTVASTSVGGVSGYRSAVSSVTGNVPESYNIGSTAPSTVQGQSFARQAVLPGERYQLNIDQATYYRPISPGSSTYVTKPQFDYQTAAYITAEASDRGYITSVSSPNLPRDSGVYMVLGDTGNIKEDIGGKTSETFIQAPGYYKYASGVETGAPEIKKAYKGAIEKQGVEIIPVATSKGRDVFTLASGDIRVKEQEAANISVLKKSGMDYAKPPSVGTATDMMSVSTGQAMFEKRVPFVPAASSVSTPTPSSPLIEPSSWQPSITTAKVYPESMPFNLATEGAPARTAGQTEALVAEGLGKTGKSIVPGSFQMSESGAYSYQVTGARLTPESAVKKAEEAARVSSAGPSATSASQLQITTPSIQTGMQGDDLSYLQDVGVLLVKSGLEVDVMKRGQVAVGEIKTIGEKVQRGTKTFGDVAVGLDTAGKEIGGPSNPAVARAVGELAYFGTAGTVSYFDIEFMKGLGLGVATLGGTTAELVATKGFKTAAIETGKGAIETLGTPGGFTASLLPGFAGKEGLVKVATYTTGTVAATSIGLNLAGISPKGEGVMNQLSAVGAGQLDVGGKFVRYATLTSRPGERSDIVVSAGLWNQPYYAAKIFPQTGTGPGGLTKEIAYRAANVGAVGFIGLKSYSDVQREGASGGAARALGRTLGEISFFENVLERHTIDPMFEESKIYKSTSERVSKEVMAGKIDPAKYRDYWSGVSYSTVPQSEWSLGSGAVKATPSVELGGGGRAPIVPATSIEVQARGAGGKFVSGTTVDTEINIRPSVKVEEKPPSVYERVQDTVRIEDRFTPDTRIEPTMKATQDIYPDTKFSPIDSSVYLRPDVYPDVYLTPESRPEPDIRPEPEIKPDTKPDVPEDIKPDIKPDYDVKIGNPGMLLGPIAAALGGPGGGGATATSRISRVSGSVLDLLSVEMGARRVTGRAAAPPTFQISSVSTGSRTRTASSRVPSGRPVGRPRIHPVKQPSGRGPGRPPLSAAEKRQREEMKDAMAVAKVENKAKDKLANLRRSKSLMF